MIYYLHIKVVIYHDSGRNICFTWPIDSVYDICVSIVDSQEGNPVASQKKRSSNVFVYFT